MNNQFSVQGRLIEARKKAEQGNWFPACDGTETEFKTRSGMRLLYCYQPSTGNHAYLNLDTDIILTDQEAWDALNPESLNSGYLTRKSYESVKVQ
jgi:hypothetical protein